MADPEEMREGLRQSILTGVFGLGPGEVLSRARAEEAFDELDRDGSGAITVDEFAESASGGRKDEESLAVARLVVGVFDSDGDSMISRAEFCDFLCVAAEPAKVSAEECSVIRNFLLAQVFQVENAAALDKAAIKAMYATFDNDSNGSLDADEFAVAAQRLGFEGLTPPELKLCMGMFDGDGDGRVSEAEFVEFFLQVGSGDSDGKAVGGAEEGADGKAAPAPRPSPAEVAMIRQFLLDNVFQVTSAKQLTPEFVKKAFVKADKDGSGTISAAEFGAVLNTLGFGNVTEQELQLGVQAFDMDGDGQVDWHEFEVFFFEEKLRQCAPFEVKHPKQQKHLLEVLKVSEGHEHLKTEMLKFFAQHDKAKIDRVDEMIHSHYCGKL